MLPSSSSHLARYGQLNHYKKFWLLQTQLEKQEPTSTTLSLGVSGSNSNAKESKPIISSNAHTTNGDHLINNNNHNSAGHGCCRADMVSSSASTSRAGAFPYCSNEPSASFKAYTSRLGFTHNMSNGTLRDSPALISLAVNCESVAQYPINFLNQSSWTPSSYTSVAELPSRNSPHLAPTQTHIPGQTKSNRDAEECDSSEWINGRGEKRGLVWNNASTSSSSLSSKQQREHADPSSLIPSSLQQVAVLPSSSRSGHGCVGFPRTCTLCGTSKTPLWRSGPDGPKSLCNACGIRVKKMKRLQAAMEATGEGAERIISSAAYPTGANYKRLLAAAATSTKAGKRGGSTHKRKLSMEAAENQSDPVFQMSKKKKAAGNWRSGSCCSWPPPNVAGADGGTCHRVSRGGPANLVASAVTDSTSSKKLGHSFAKDVEEAAVLLMALSCGLVLS